MQETDHYTKAEGAESDVNSLRPLLTTYAYNITGSLEDARDMVQDAYLRFMQAAAPVDNPRAYLVRTVINLSINRQQQRKRTEYPGQWLPEPVVTHQPDTALLRNDVLHFSLLVLLEKLNARERAVFILREAFHYGHAEIAAALDISAAGSRQLLSRARNKLQAPPVAAPPRPHKDFLDKYLRVIRQGDTARLEKLLNEDITAISDGGGKVAAAQKPVYGIRDVSAMLLGMFGKFYLGAEVQAGSVNHQPALFYYLQGKLMNCQVFLLKNGGVSGVYFVRNPDKLRALEKKA
ncbi:sigma-70 family RNA polymerase sigma factor [Chitinophaga alhagiae]|uniref:sigma-70 family RNA polymerase sigma factor n=1 Tax=Chitinophaga alhagiae TaxID=2203219 RepID=UPI000E5A94CA|nr:sigma-70 family RNA polymerase sigma factor [Chitinophaga alhagiae]